MLLLWNQPQLFRHLMQVISLFFLFLFLLTFCLGLIEQALKLVPDDVVNLVLKIEVTKQKKRVPHFIAATTSRFVVLNVKAKVLSSIRFFCLLS